MKNILVIEDSKMLNKVITSELKKFDFNVSQAYTLKESQNFLKENSYQLIILDLHLPDGEGSELVKSIQSLTKTKVIVLTSDKSDNLREELFEYGILDYIIKDKNILYSITEVIKIINIITKKRKDKVLVIDDSAVVCKQIEIILGPRNYEVVRALTARDGLDKLSKEKFDLVILDMELPDLHGLKVLEMIRRNKRFLSLPIIILSGTSTPEIIRNCLKNGASDFLKKPFVFEEFILKIDLWIDYYRKEDELKAKTAQLEFVNNNLEKLVSQEVEKNREKDKLMFTQSRQAQMGEMIAMIAHQWRQPLNAISSAVSLMDMRMQSKKLDEKMAKDITTKVLGYIQHLSNTIDDFKNFFKPQKEKKLSSFDVIVHKAITLIEHSLQNKSIDIEFKIKSVKEFVSYENELMQVILNLLKNSEDAYDCKDIKNKKIIITIDSYKLSIEDNAGGIDEDIIEKVFDPYFSTKGKNGTGLGLYMSKMIVEEHCNGKISAKNIENGVIFGIVLSKNEVK